MRLILWNFSCLLLCSTILILFWAVWFNAVVTNLKLFHYTKHLFSTWPYDNPHLIFIRKILQNIHWLLLGFTSPPAYSYSIHEFMFLRLSSCLLIHMLCNLVWLNTRKAGYHFCGAFLILWTCAVRNWSSCCLTCKSLKIIESVVSVDRSNL